MRIKMYIVPTLRGWQAVREGHRRGREYTTAWSAGRGARRYMLRWYDGGDILYMNTSNKVTRAETVRR